MNEHEVIYVAVVEKYTFVGVNTLALMKYKHKGHANEWRHNDYYHVVLRSLPGTPNYKMHREWEAAEDQGSFRLQTSLRRSYLQSEGNSS